jgi:hypothetical protein
MSYDIDLKDPVTKETIEVGTPHQMRGGTYQVGGSTQLSLSITYNYGKIFQKVLGKDGIRAIYGMTGAESIGIIKGSAAKLSDDVSDDYWQPTEGNAKRALLQLVALAQMRPDGVWHGD